MAVRGEPQLKGMNHQQTPGRRLEAPGGHDEAQKGGWLVELTPLRLGKQLNGL